MFDIESEQTFEDGEVIVKEGQTPDWVYVVLSGAVEISKTVGGKKCVIAMLQAGEAFGELGLFEGITRTAAARAVGQTSVGLVDPAFLDREFDHLSLGFKTVLVSVVETMRKMVDRACDFSARTEMRVLATWPVRYEDKGAFIDAYTGNLSSGGLFVKTENPLKPGEQFWLELQLPELTEPIRIKAEVVWARDKTQKAKQLEPGMGLKFIEIIEKDLETLKHYLKPLKNQARSRDDHAC